MVAWFLGAGASAASGIPTGYAMIRDFKARIFSRANNLSMREIDSADPVWIERIDAFFRQTSSLPLDGDPEEYAAAFEAVYPQSRHRRQYIDDAISKGTPCFGHNVLGSLMAAGKVDCVFTTNFDPLIEESALSANSALPISDQIRPTVAAIDSSDRAKRCLDESDWPLVGKLHGDYQSISIKNTGAELEKQDVQMRHVLVEVGQRYGMVFLGYSGRDASIMDALNSILDGSSPFPNGLYWVTSSASRMLPAVSQFLERAHLAGVDVAIVECTTFDELAAEILKTTDLPEILFDRVMIGRPEPRLVPVQPPTSEARLFPILRYSALLIDNMPRTARRISLTTPTTSLAVRSLLKQKKCRAAVAAHGRELAVFGNDQEIVAALEPFGAKTAGEIELDPEADSWALGLIYDALVRSLSRYPPLIPRLRRSGHSVVVATPNEGENLEWSRRNKKLLSGLRGAYGAELTGTIPDLGFPYLEGVFLKLDQVDGRWWCGFEPHTFVDAPRLNYPEHGTPDQPEPTDLSPAHARPGRGGDPAGDWRRERWAQRYNRNWAYIIDAWAKLLTVEGGRSSAFGLQDGQGIDANFEISPVTGWSRPSHHHVYFDRSK